MLKCGVCMEKAYSETNIKRSYKLFYPYMNEGIFNVCIVRKCEDDKHIDNSIYDIFSTEMKFSVERDDNMYVKGFRFANRKYDTKQFKFSINHEMHSFYSFVEYIKEFYNIDLSEYENQFYNKTWLNEYCCIKHENLIFYMYRTHRRIRHRCEDRTILKCKYINYDMITIAEKSHGFYSDTYCPLCIGPRYGMLYEDYKKLNGIKKFL